MCITPRDAPGAAPALPGQLAAAAGAVARATDKPSATEGRRASGLASAQGLRSAHPDRAVRTAPCAVGCPKVRACLVKGTRPDGSSHRG